MRPVDELIDRLARDALPVQPLRPPLARALAWLGSAALLSGVSIYLLSDVQMLLVRNSGREELMALEMAAMLATGVLAVVGAFFVAIPGRSRQWLLVPLAPFAAWLLLSGAGCYRDLLHNGRSGLAIGHSFDCLIFIVTVSAVIGAPLIWLLSRARPIDPLPVALLGGLGTAAIAAFVLQFFHPFAVTFVDLGFHLFAIAVVVTAAALLNRRALSPA
jgi:hypothetical protein